MKKNSPAASPLIAEHHGIISFNYGWYCCLWKVEGLHAARVGMGPARPSTGQRRGAYSFESGPLTTANHKHHAPHPCQGRYTLAMTSSYPSMYMHSHMHTHRYTCTLQHTCIQLHHPHPLTVIHKFNQHRYPHHPWSTHTSTHNIGIPSHDKTGTN